MCPGNHLAGELRSGISGKIYWRASASPLAYRDGPTHFEHQDWEATEHLRTSYTGSVEASFNTLPFGEIASSSGSTGDPYSYAFLDKDRYGSSDSNPDHAQFRQYNTAQGRWMSPDHYFGSYDITNPQSFNRYSYVLNTPICLEESLKIS